MLLNCFTQLGRRRRSTQAVQLFGRVDPPSSLLCSRHDDADAGDGTVMGGMEERDASGREGNRGTCPLSVLCYGKEKEANTYQDYETRDGQRAWRDIIRVEAVLVSRLLRVGNGRNCNGETSV